MKVLRFMSLAEFEKYRAGEILTNETKHQAYTDAKGFCFLNADDYEPQYAYEFLSGIVSSQVCAIFECKDIFYHGSGTFADPYGSFFGSIGVDELSTTEYSDKQLKLVKFCDDFSDKYEGETFKHKFDFKPANSPIRRQIRVIDKSTKPRAPKPDTPEQRLLDAIAEFAATRLNVTIPPEYFDGFRLISAPTLNIERSFDGETLNIDGLAFAKQDPLKFL